MWPSDEKGDRLVLVFVADVNVAKPAEVSDGDATAAAVELVTTDPVLDRGSRQGGAAAFAAVPMLVETQRIDRNDVVVVFDTGAGFKSEAPGDLTTPIRVPNDPDNWEGVLSHLVKRA